MAIAVQTVSNTPTLASRVNTTIVAPTGITNGDVLVAWLHVGNGSTTPIAVTLPAGWAEDPNSPTVHSKTVGTYSIAMHVYTKTAASESGDYTWTHATADTEGFMYRLSGASVTGMVSAKQSAIVAALGDPTNYPTLTTAADNSFLMYGESDWDGPDIFDPDGTTPVIVGRRIGVISWIGDGTLATAGATGARTRNNGNNNGADATSYAPWASFILALQPAGVTSIVLGDRVIDNGLVALDTDCDKVFICSAMPTSYAEATFGALSLGNKNWGVGNAFSAPAARAGGGRQITSVAITDGNVTANGTAANWAAVDTVNARLLASGSMTGSKAVTSGQVFTLTAMTFGIPNT